MTAARSRSLRSALRALGRETAYVLVLIGLLFVLWLGGLIWFAESIPRVPVDDTRRSDAVAVLTGGPLRLKEGLTILAEGRADKLFVSGVYRTVDVTELLRIARQTPSSLECCIVLGYSADSTAGNAAETRDWMLREGYRSLRLVTASYHMRRSLLEFRRALPEATIIAHPVFPDTFRREAWWMWPGTLALVVSEYNKYLAALAWPLFANPVVPPAEEP